jgi:hypothetical protein
LIAINKDLIAYQLLRKKCLIYFESEQQRIMDKNSREVRKNLVDLLYCKIIPYTQYLRGSFIRLKIGSGFLLESVTKKMRLFYLD